MNVRIGWLISVSMTYNIMDTVWGVEIKILFFGSCLEINLIVAMVLKTGTVKELENELITGFMIGPGSDRWSNR